jgi:hypothetical protein
VAPVAYSLQSFPRHPGILQITVDMQYKYQAHLHPSSETMHCHSELY